MNASPTPKRRWFQFHLSTLLFAVLVSSLMLYINTLPYERSHLFPKEVQVLYLGETQHEHCGWPYSAWSSHVHWDGTGRWTEWNYRELCADILIGLGMTLLVTFIFEYIMRMPLTRKKVR